MATSAVGTFATVPASWPGSAPWVTQTGSAAVRQLMTDEPTSRVVLSLRSGRLIFELSGSEPNEPRWFYQSLACFKELLDLQRGWDSYDAELVTDDAIEGAAQALIDLDLPPEAPAPSVVPGSSGCVQLEWHEAGADVEIHISAEGDATAYLFDDDHEHDFEELDGTAIVRLSQAFSRMVP